MHLGMYLFLAWPDDPGESAPAELEGDVDGRGDEEDLERRVHGHQFVDEDADAAPHSAPVLE
jgi:hypothetical protein